MDRGRFSLHGIERQQTIRSDLKIFTDSGRFQGEDPLRLSDEAINPVTALGGAILIQDPLRLRFDLFAAPGTS